MQSVAFTMQQVRRLSVLHHLPQGGITHAQAAEALAVSVRQAQRLGRTTHFASFV